MYIVPQISLFDNDQIEILGDLERLDLAIKNIPDGHIIRKLEKMRKNGRNDWPVVAMWNSFVASFVFNHRSVSDLLRELSRNSQLRNMCGFKPKYIKQDDGTVKVYIVPSEAAYTRFLSNLIQCTAEISKAFEELNAYMYENLDKFGEDLVGDGKAIDTFATSNGKGNDRRSDKDANWAVKKYTESTNDKGEKVIKKKTWFGYRLHLIVDATYELPVAYKVTKASNSEKTEMLKMLEDLKEKREKVLNVAKKFFADKGYDYTKLIEFLEDNDISPVIDIQNHWSNGEETKQYKDTDLVYTYDGKVYLVDDFAKKIKLVYAGYDKKTKTLRYKLPAHMKDNRVFRIKIEEDIRIFTPIARDSKKWKREYKKRTSVERANGRLDRDYGFEVHTIRGKAKMELFVGMAFLVQLSMAKGKIEANKKEHLAGLVA